MKTVAEIAVEIGVSKQAVHKKIKRQPLSISLRQFTSTNGNTLMFDNDGVALIKEVFNKENRQPNVNRTSTKSSTSDNQSSTSDNQSSTKNVSFDDELIGILKENISVLQGGLEIKNKQIEELTVVVKNLSESINVVSKNELAETIIDGNKKLIEDEKSKNKFNIFKIFSRKK